MANITANPIFCTSEEHAMSALAAIFADARGGMVAVDLETAPSPSEAARAHSLRLALAAVKGRLKAARRLKAPTIDLQAEARRLTAALRHAEAAGLDSNRARIRLLQVYGGGDRVAVIDLDRTGLGPLRQLEGRDIIAHNAAFELAFLEAEGVQPGEVHDTLQAVRLTLGEYSTSLKDAAKAHLGIDLDKSEQAGDWNADHLTAAQIEYAASDVVTTYRLARAVIPYLGEQELAYSIQMTAVPATMRMERRGFKLDVEAHARLIVDLKKDRLAAEQEYREACIATATRRSPTRRRQRRRRRRPCSRRCFRATNLRAGAGRRSPGRSRPGAASCSVPATTRRFGRS